MILRTWTWTTTALALAVAAASSGAGLESLAWMSGAWEGSDGSVEMEEVWTAPKGGSMLGLHRDVVGAETRSFEFLRIESAADGITYWASPGGRPATPFRLASAEERRAVFENAKHDFPNRILYWLSQDGALHARVEGVRRGKPAAEEWTWRRAR